MDQTKDFIGTLGAARIAEKSEDTIRRWHREGILPGHTTDSGHRFFDRAVVEKVVAEMKGKNGKD